MSVKTSDVVWSINSGVEFFIQHNCDKMIDPSLIYLVQGSRRTKDPHISGPAAVSGPKTLLGRGEIGVTIRQGE